MVTGKEERTEEKKKCQKREMKKVDRGQKGNNLTCVLKQTRAMKETD